MWLKELPHVLESTLEPRTRSIRKNLRESDPEPVRILVSSRTRPGSARELERILKPNLDPSNDLSKF